MFFGWKSWGCELVFLCVFAEVLDLKNLPRNEIAIGAVAGRSGSLAMQGKEYLS